MSYVRVVGMCGEPLEVERRHREPRQDAGAAPGPSCAGPAAAPPLVPKVGREAGHERSVDGLAATSLERVYPVCPVALHMNEFEFTLYAHSRRRVPGAASGSVRRAPGPAREAEHTLHSTA